MTLFLRLELKCAPVSWNKIITSHWRRYKALKDEIGIFTHIALQKAMKGRILPTVAYPVHIRVHAKWKGKRQRDIDNIFSKSILDFLVKRGILAGDDTRYVESVTYTGEINAKEEGIDFEIASKD